MPKIRLVARPKKTTSKKSTSPRSSHASTRSSAGSASSRPATAPSSKLSTTSSTPTAAEPEFQFKETVSPPIARGAPAQSIDSILASSKPVDQRASARHGGRRPGAGRKPARVQGLDAAPSGPASDASDSSGTAAAAPAEGAALGAPPIPPALLGPIVEMPFNAAAARTGFEGFKLTAPERDGLVPLVDTVLRQYAPMMAGPHAAAISLGVGLGSLAFTKYLAFSAWRAEQAKLERAKFERGEISNPIHRPVPSASSRPPEARQ